MAVIDVKCPMCKEANMIKFGTNTTGKQRYQCKNEYCAKDTFLLEYFRNGDLPEIKQKIIDMALNGSGIRDTSRVLAVISELKKENSIITVNQELLAQRQSIASGELENYRKICLPRNVL